MPENDTLRGDWENRLRAGLRELESGTPGGGGLPGPNQVRRTHLRRRSALAAASALAAVVVAGGTVLALNRPSTSAPVAPTTTEPAPTATAAPSPTTAEPSTDPTPPVTSGPAVVVPTTIPAGFLLPHEGEPAPEESDLTAWTELEPPELRPCQWGLPNVDLPLATPTDQRWIAQTGPEYAHAVALQVFESADTASAHLAALTALAEDCLRTQRGASQITVAEDLPGTWGQGTLWVENYRAEGAETGDEFGLGGTYTLVVRIGSAIAVSQGYGESAPALDGPDADIVADLREPLDELAPRLCVFTQAGC